MLDTAPALGRLRFHVPCLALHMEQSGTCWARALVSFMAARGFGVAKMGNRQLPACSSFSRGVLEPPSLRKPPHA